MTVRSASTLAGVLGTLALLTLTAGCASDDARASATHTATHTAAHRSAAASSAATPGVDREPPAGAVPGPGGAGTPTAPRTVRPVRIEVPAIGVDAALTDLGVAADGSIEVPSVPSRAGWLDTTPAPGQQGPAVIAGHVDSESGPAVFYRLSSLKVGDRIDVVRRDGSTASFTVDGVRLYPQSRFPTDEVYGPVPGPALRLITCGGDYVKADGGYQDNVVVYAS